MFMTSTWKETHQTAKQNQAEHQNSLLKTIFSAKAKAEAYHPTDNPSLHSLPFTAPSSCLGHSGWYGLSAIHHIYYVFLTYQIHDDIKENINQV